MSKIKVEIKPIKDNKSNYLYDVVFEIDEEEVEMEIYDDTTEEHRIVTFKKEQLKKLQKIIEASE